MSEQFHYIWQTSLSYRSVVPFTACSRRENNGAVHHEFVIMKYGTTVGESFGDEDEENIYWEHEVEPGQTMSVTFTAPTEPGAYQFACGIVRLLHGWNERNDSRSSIVIITEREPLPVLVTVR